MGSANWIGTTNGANQPCDILFITEIKEAKKKTKKVTYKRGIL